MRPHGEYEETGLVPSWLRVTNWSKTDFKKYKRGFPDAPNLAPKPPGADFNHLLEERGESIPPITGAPKNTSIKEGRKRPSRANPLLLKEYRFLKGEEIVYRFNHILDFTNFFGESKNYFSSRINRGYLAYKGMTIKIFQRGKDITPEAKTPKSTKTQIRIIFPDGSTQDFKRFSDAEKALNLPRNVIAHKNRTKKRDLPGGLKFQIIQEVIF